MNKGFMKITAVKGLTISTDILDDSRMSLGAKGLYVQLIYSNNHINSLEDLSKYCNSTIEDIKNYVEELTNNGYLIPHSKDGLELVRKPKNDKAVQKLDKDAIMQTANTAKEPEKKLNKYEIMVKIINSYDVPNNVKQLLIVYFEQWLNKKGRFAEADDLHGGKVRSLIGELISFHISEPDMLKSVQLSIDKGYYKFINLANNQNKSVPTRVNNFDKSEITSGSYTEDDIKQIKEKAEAMNAEGKKGTF